VPDSPTEISTSGFAALNSSATAWVSGPTVLEPSIRRDPETPVGASDEPPDAVLSSPPQAATRSASADAETAAAKVFRIFT
jgi:hypothetical protein